MSDSRTSENPRSLEMRRLYVVEGLTMREIGSRYGISRERVRQLLHPFGLKKHGGAAKRNEREARIKAAFDRYAGGVTTVDEEWEDLGFSSSHSLRNAFQRRGFVKQKRRKGPAAHGTRTKYDKHGCRCPKCRAAARQAYRERKEQGPKEHGTMSAYRNYGCRCDECREAERLYQRDLKIRKRQAKEPVV